jgi:hypothetical protein
MAQALVRNRTLRRRKRNTIGQEARTMGYTDSGNTVKRSLRTSRKFVSSRLAEELLGKAYGYLIPPVKHLVSKHSLERVERVERVERNVHTSVSSA